MALALEASLLPHEPEHHLAVFFKAMQAFSDGVVRNTVSDPSPVKDMDSPDVWAARTPRKYLATLYKTIYTARMSTIAKTLKLPFLRLNRAKAEEFAYLQVLNTSVANNIFAIPKARDVC